MKDGVFLRFSGLWHKGIDGPRNATPTRNPYGLLEAAIVPYSSDWIATILLYMALTRNCRLSLSFMYIRRGGRLNCECNATRHLFDLLTVPRGVSHSLTHFYCLFILYFTGDSYSLLDETRYSDRTIDFPWSCELNSSSASSCHFCTGKPINLLNW